MDDKLFTCPVCGMARNPDVPLAEHNGMHYYFCTPQCRETFLEHPRLYSTRKPSHQHLLKCRIFKMNKPLFTGQRDGIQKILGEMMGVESISIEEGDLAVSYDLLQVSASQIEAQLDSAGYTLNRGWLHRLRRSWIHEREETELANRATGKAPCCNQSPKGR